MEYSPGSVPPSRSGGQDELRAGRHAGISDEECLITLKVLQRLTRDTGGQAWHH
ncbi:hypothetical protein ACIRBZ_38355 [Streptomyces sp. NPDC094038]|uniref:hypothetical protein n=1 Tax=Streptomyces sp. NPDC094038 TaxID=3366055 RepID=UPI00380296F8